METEISRAANSGRSTRLSLILWVTLGVAGAGGCAKPVRPDDMSAEAHRHEAAKETAAAQHQVDLANATAPPPNLAVAPTGNPEGYFYPANAYNPNDDHLLTAEQLQEHARQHRQAAAELEGYVEAECKDFPSSTRAACPLLGPVVEIGDIEGGVRIRFAAGTRVDAVLAHMRCHYAYAEARGFGKAADCPLYIRGITIRAGKDPLSIDIVGPNTKTMAEIRRLSRAEAVVVHNDKKSGGAH